MRDESLLNHRPRPFVYIDPSVGKKITEWEDLISTIEAREHLQTALQTSSNPRDVDGSEVLVSYLASKDVSPGSFDIVKSDWDKTRLDKLKAHREFVRSARRQEAQEKLSMEGSDASTASYDASL